MLIILIIFWVEGFCWRVRFLILQSWPPKSELSGLRQKGSKFEGKVGYVVKSCLTKQLEYELILAI